MGTSKVARVNQLWHDGIERLYHRKLIQDFKHIMFEFTGNHKLIDKVVISLDKTEVIAYKNTISTLHVKLVQKEILNRQENQ